MKEIIESLTDFEKYRLTDAVWNFLFNQPDVLITEDEKKDLISACKKLSIPIRPGAKEIILSHVETNMAGFKVLYMHNARLSFEAEFIFLGFTKSGNVKLGDIYASGPNKEDWKWTNIIGKVEEEEYEIIVRTKQFSYAKRMMRVKQ